MNESTFWTLIEAAHDRSGGDMDEKCDAIRDALTKLSAEEATAFLQHFDAAMARAYAWPVWGAAYVVHGGCGDDSFSDFRSALISRGRQGFETAVSTPDSLADEPFDDDVWFYEGYQYAVVEGAEAAIGASPPRSFPNDPAGEPWDEEETILKEMFPRLWERHQDVWTADPEHNKPAAPENRPWWKFWGS